MILETILNETAEQFYFVNHPIEYISSILFYKKPNSSVLLNRFKYSGVYQNLANNLKDTRITSEIKNKFTLAYVDVLNSVGMAIESAILQDVDNILFKVENEEALSEQTKDKLLNKSICDYFDYFYYCACIHEILPTANNLLDSATSIIANGQYKKTELDKLTSIKKHFDGIAIQNRKFLRYLNNFFDKELEFNYESMINMLEALYLTARHKEMSKPSSKQTTKIKANSPKPFINNNTLSIDEALDKNFKDLVGLKAVKEGIKQKAKLILKIPNKAIDLNYRIVGNPGVGKTTVGQAMARTFFDIGILKSPTLVYLNGAELKAQYVGHTTEKVKEIFTNAKGGTVFLDEVYSLAESKTGGDSFTQEAITQLMIEVEQLYQAQLKDPSNKTLVLMAGYKDKLNALLDKNIGFRRRFSNIFELPDYSVPELEEIFINLMEKDGFEMTDNANALLKDVLKSQKEQKNFSNAGYVRNLLQKAEEFQAGRADDTDFCINDSDIEQASNAMDDREEEKRAIGF